MKPNPAFKKHGITARKHGGDDAYSWAVFVNNRPVIEGLSKSEVSYYKQQVLIQCLSERP